MPKSKKTYRRQVPVASSKKSYRVKFTMAGATVEATSDSLLQAIEQVKPDFIKGGALLTVDYDGKHAEKRLIPIHIRRLFMNPIARQLLEKRITLLLR